VIISVIYLLIRCLLGCLTVLLRGQVSKDAELVVLRHENAVLRRHRQPATGACQPRRPPDPPETGPRGTHQRVLHRRLTTLHCNGKTQITTRIIFPSLTGTPEGGQPCPREAPRAWRARERPAQDRLDEYVYHTRKAGASGFLLKDASREQLTVGVRAVPTGETLLASAITRRLIEDLAAGSRQASFGKHSVVGQRPLPVSSASCWAWFQQRTRRSGAV
jgi:hypothetical protein